MSSSLKKKDNDSGKGTVQAKKSRRMSRQSKREVEEIQFQKHAELYKPLFLPSPTASHDTENNREIREYLKANPVKVGAGEFRLLTSRLILKKPSTPWQAKPRILNVPYNRIRDCFILPDHGEFLIMYVDADEKQEAGSPHYEFVKFDKANVATNCKEVLDGLGYAENAREPIIEHSRSDSVESGDAPVPIFETECEFRQFDMRLFHEFPTILPREVVQSFNDEHLDERAVMAVYEDGVILNSMDQQNKDGRRLWSTNFHRVLRMYVEQSTNQQFVFTVDDESSRPNHYNLVRTLKAGDYHEKLMQAYGAKSGVVKRVSPTEVPKFARKSPKQQPKQQSQYRPDDSIKMETVDMVRSSAPMSKTPSRYQTNGSNGYQGSTGFVQSPLKSHMLKVNAMARSSVRSKDDLMKLPDDGSKWETECATIRTFPDGRTVIDENGSVVLFVAHRVA